jgi:hypothetical protein
MEIVFLRLQVITSGIKMSAALVTSLSESIDILSGDAKKKVEAAEKYAADVDFQNIKLMRAGKMTLAELERQSKENSDKVKALNEKYGGSYDRLMATLGESIGDIVKKTLSAPGDIKDIMEKLNDAFAKGAAEYKDNLKKFNEGSEPKGGNGDYAKKQISYIDEVNKRFNAATKDQVKSQNDAQFLMVDSAAKAAEQEKAIFEDVAKTVQDTATTATGLVSQLFSDLDMYYQNQLDQIDITYNAQTKALDDDYKNQTAANNKSLLSDADKKKKQDLLDKQYNDKKVALEKDKAAKESAIKRQQFDTDKTGKIISAIINTAVAITSALSTQPIWLGLAMAAITGVLGGIEIGMIASQPNPYAAGGTAEGLALVGEKGPELAYFSNPTKIFSNEDSQKLLNKSTGDFNVNFNGNIDSSVDLDKAMNSAYWKYKGYRSKI